MTRRKGIIGALESSDGWFTMQAESPLNDMFGFAIELRSATQVNFCVKEIFFKFKMLISFRVRESTVWNMPDIPKLT